MKKIKCVYHNDKTASMALYDNSYHCFGCGRHGKLSEIGLKPTPGTTVGNIQEDVNESIGRIRQLPTMRIRGFDLPYDNTGYYLLFPGSDYYLKRFDTEDTNTKYFGPKGVKKPLFWAKRTTSNKVLFIVEGQFNALTLAKFTEYNVVSPGGASDLVKKNYHNEYLQYSKIVVIVDKDAAGVVGGITLRDELLKHKKRVSLYPMEVDLNDLYQQENAEEKIKKEIARAMELL